jgi:2-iminobutanoate/2-iminopropanoate deaminase
MKSIETVKAPAAIGPYSQAVCSGTFVFVSGQLPIDPANGLIVSGGIVDQTNRAIDNLEAVLFAAGSSIEHVVKTEVFLKNMSDFAAMNEVYASRFTGKVKPARATVEVSRIPKDALIEIACFATIS